MSRLRTDAEDVGEFLAHRCRSQHFEPRKRRVYEVLFAELLKLGAPSTSENDSVSGRRCTGSRTSLGLNTFGEMQDRRHPSSSPAPPYPLRSGVGAHPRKQTLETRRCSTNPIGLGNHAHEDAIFVLSTPHLPHSRSNIGTDGGSDSFQVVYGDFGARSGIRKDREWYPG